MQKLFQLEIVRFCLIGLLSTICDFSIYKYLLSQGIYFSVAKLLSMGQVMILSFILNKKYCFKINNNIKKVEIQNFIITQLANLFINISTNYFLFILTDSIIISFIFATITATFFNFTLQKYWVFRRHS